MLKQIGACESPKNRIVESVDRRTLGIGRRLGCGMCAMNNFECGVLQLGRFLCLRAKLDNLSVSSSPQFPFQRRPEVRRNIKINHLRHHYLLWVRIFGGRGRNSLLPQETPP